MAIMVDKNNLYLLFNTLRWGKVQGNQIIFEAVEINGGEFLEFTLPNNLVPIYSVLENGGRYPSEDEHRQFRKLILF